MLKEDIITTLISHGLKVTPQRIAILDATITLHNLNKSIKINCNKFND